MLDNSHSYSDALALALHLCAQGWPKPAAAEMKAYLQLFIDTVSSDTELLPLVQPLLEKGNAERASVARVLNNAGKLVKARWPDLPPPLYKGKHGTLQDIIDSALWLFDNQGYVETSIREIAESAGIKGGSIYNHFPSKEALFYEVVIKCYRELTTGTSEATESLMELDAIKYRLEWVCGLTPREKHVCRIIHKICLGAFKAEPSHEQEVARLMEEQRGNELRKMRPVFLNTQSATSFLDYIDLLTQRVLFSKSEIPFEAVEREFHNAYSFHLLTGGNQLEKVPLAVLGNEE